MVKMVLVVSLSLLIMFVGSTAIADQFNVLIVLGDQSGQAESSALQTFEQVENNTFTFTELNIATGGTRPIGGGVIPAEAVADGDLNWFDYQIIWFSWNGPGHDGDYFMDGTEDDLLAFVEGGGVIYMSAFDDNYRDAQGLQIGSWMPLDDFPCGVDNTGDSDVEITPEGEKTTLFSVPNELDNGDLNALVLDDNLAPQADEYVSLANRTDNSKPAIAILPYGDGAYVEVCIDARSTFPAATPLLENLLHYIAGLTVPEAVSPADKLYSVWGSIKSSQ